MAKLSATNAHATENLCLIRTPIWRLNPGTEYGRQVFYQLTEINTSVCSKIKQQFIVIKRILSASTSFIFSLCFCIFFLTGLISLSLLLGFSALFCHLRSRCTKVPALTAVPTSSSVTPLWRHHNRTIFHTSCSLNDYMTSQRQFQIFWIKIINFSCCAETHAYYFYHILQILLITYIYLYKTFTAIFLHASTHLFIVLYFRNSQILFL